MESLKELWRKEFLPNIRKEICTEIDTLKVSLHELNKRLDEIEKSQSFISKKYDTVISTITTLKKHNEDVKGQVQQIEEDITKLGNDGYEVEVKLEELEQYTQRDCLEITGIPIVPHDNPALLVKENYGSESRRKRYIDRSSPTANEEGQRSVNRQVYSPVEKG